MELLCIQTHSQGAVIAGNVYTLISDKCPCRCEAYDVGIEERFYDGGQPVVIGQACICGDCGQYVISDGIWWIAKSRFIPIATQEEMECLNKQEVTI